MPSDDLATRALAALKAPRAAFTAPVAAAVEEVRAYLAAHRPAFDGRAAENARLELGPFAAGRIDAARFGSLFTGSGPLDAVSLVRVEDALAVLTRVAAAGDGLFRVELEPGGDLRLAVAHALAYAGRAFAAAQVVARIRAGRAGDVATTHEGFPFRRWNRAERQIAPPLVVELDGADLHPAGLADFLDGAVKIVLVVRGAMAPAPLVRLITPGVYVAQADDATAVDALAAVPVPAVVALVPEGAARFVHDPAGGETIGRRLRVDFIPETTELAAVGGVSPFQQHEELAWLLELAAAPAAGPVSGDAAPAAGPGLTIGGAPEAEVEKLAAWLLREAGLEEGR
ncbi:MAG TPA: hypothetical protein VF771_00830 [Longimicrobiaceae bacterium]